MENRQIGIGKSRILVYFFILSLFNSLALFYIHPGYILKDSPVFPSGLVSIFENRIAFVLSEIQTGPQSRL